MYRQPLTVAQPLLHLLPLTTWKCYRNVWEICPSSRLDERDVRKAQLQDVIDANELIYIYIYAFAAYIPVRLRWFYPHVLRPSYSSSSEKQILSNWKRRREKRKKNQ